MEGLLCDLLWADPSDDPGVTNIDSLSDQVRHQLRSGYTCYFCSASVAPAYSTHKGKRDRLASMLTTLPVVIHWIAAY